MAYFGAPGKFHSNGGGEFANDVFCEMNKKLGTETNTTPGESPFSRNEQQSFVWGLVWASFATQCESLLWRKLSKWRQSVL